MLKPGIIRKSKKRYPIGITVYLDQKTYLPIYAEFFVRGPDFDVIEAKIDKGHLHELLSYYRIDLTKAREIIENKEYEGTYGIPIVHIYCDHEGTAVVDYNYFVDGD